MLNLLLVDPYYKDIQVALFKSSAIFDNNILNVNDFVVKACVQSSREWKDDLYFEIAIWAQFQDAIVKSDIISLEMVESNGQLLQDKYDHLSDKENDKASKV